MKKTIISILLFLMGCSASYADWGTLCAVDNSGDIVYGWSYGQESEAMAIYYATTSCYNEAISKNIPPSIAANCRDTPTNCVVYTQWGGLTAGAPNGYKLYFGTGSTSDTAIGASMKACQNASPKQNCFEVTAKSANNTGSSSVTFNKLNKKDNIIRELCMMEV